MCSESTMIDTIGPRKKTLITIAYSKIMTFPGVIGDAKSRLGAARLDPRVVIARRPSARRYR